MSKPVSPYVMFVWENKGTKIKPEMEEGIRRIRGIRGNRGNRGKIGIWKFGSNQHQIAYMLLKYFPVHFIFLILE